MENISNIIDERFFAAGTGEIYASIINEIEKLVIIKALELSDGNQIRAAKMLGLHRNTLSSKIRKLDIDIGSYKR